MTDTCLCGHTSNEHVNGTEVCGFCRCNGFWPTDEELKESRESFDVDKLRVEVAARIFTTLTLRNELIASSAEYAVKAADALIAELNKHE